ncbi:MAG: hypothetical protein ACMUIP_14920 [bacterium]
MKEEHIENAETYHLWYEYLKENDYYKLFCEWINMNEDTLFEKKEFIRKSMKKGQRGKILSQKTRIIRGKFIITPDQCLSLPSFPEELRECKYFPKLFEVFKFWEDIHSISWEEKLENITYLLYRDKWVDPTLKISEYSPASDIEMRIKAYNKHFNKDPLLEQLRGDISLYEKHYPNHFFLRVPQKLPINVLIEQFKNILSEKQQEHKKELSFPVPTKHLTQKDAKFLRRYLKIWCMVKREGLNIHEAREKMDPNDQIHKKWYATRSWQREINNAEDIINNVGQGFFPGFYGEYKKKIKKTK